MASAISCVSAWKESVRGSSPWGTMWRRADGTLLAMSSMRLRRRLRRRRLGDRALPPPTDWMLSAACRRWDENGSSGMDARGVGVKLMPDPNCRLCPAGTGRLPPLESERAERDRLVLVVENDDVADSTSRGLAVMPDCVE